MKDHAREAALWHTNLNTWGAVVALLEGGLLYDGESSHKDTMKVIEIAKRRQLACLNKHDAALALAGGEKS